MKLTASMVKGKTRLDSLDDVRNLNMWGQDLDDVSVLGQLPNVEVLSLSVNKIASLKDFRHCHKLQELYLRKNEVSDLAELQFLSGLPNLRVLWLIDNPIADHPAYRATASRLLPQLQKLDNEDVNLDMVAPGAVRAASASPSARSPMSPMTRAGSERASMIPNLTSVMHEPSPPASGPHSSASTSSKNVLYAVMALLCELSDEDLLYVRTDINQRLAGSGR